MNGEEFLPKTPEERQLVYNQQISRTRFINGSLKLRKSLLEDQISSTKARELFVDLSVLYQEAIMITQLNCRGIALRFPQRYRQLIEEQLEMEDLFDTCQISVSNYVKRKRFPEDANQTTAYGDNLILQEGRDKFLKAFKDLTTTMNKSKKDELLEDWREQLNVSKTDENNSAKFADKFSHENSIQNDHDTKPLHSNEHYQESDSEEGNVIPKFKSRSEKKEVSKTNPINRPTRRHSHPKINESLNVQEENVHDFESSFEAAIRISNEDHQKRIQQIRMDEETYYATKNKEKAPTDKRSSKRKSKTEIPSKANIPSANFIPVPQQYVQNYEEEQDLNQDGEYVPLYRYENQMKVSPKFENYSKPGQVGYLPPPVFSTPVQENNINTPIQAPNVNTPTDYNDDQYSEEFEMFLKKQLGKKSTPKWLKTLIESEETSKIPEEINAVDEEFEAKFLPKTRIKMFKGEKERFASWWVTFTTIIDKAKVSTAFKMIKLMEALEGEPLRLVEGIGFCAGSYRKAKERLVAKYGGDGRSIRIKLDEFERLRPIREDNAKDLETLAEMVESIIIRFEDEGQEQQLGNGLLYYGIQKKLGEKITKRFERWRTENKLSESVSTLRDFINEEARITMRAAEIIKGVQDSSNVKFPKKERNHHTEVKEKLEYKNYEKKVKPKVVKNSKPYVAPSQKNNEVRNGCYNCNDSTHRIWQCKDFRNKDLKDKWKKVKELSLCFKCLTGGHPSNLCSKMQACGIKGCKGTHNRLLHEDRYPDSAGKGTTLLTEQHVDNDSNSEDMKDEGDAVYHINFNEKLALRTIPVILKNHEITVRINALMDDGSTCSYLNKSIADSLGLQGEPEEEIQVNTLNNKSNKLVTRVVETMLFDHSGKLVKPIKVYTTTKVTGNLQVYDWNNVKEKWKHLRKIPFPFLGKKTHVDLLLGNDYCELQSAEIPDVQGKEGQPIARLTALGWTCVGKIPADENTRLSFFINDTNVDVSTNKLVKKFWEFQEFQEKPLYTSLEKQGLQIAKITCKPKGMGFEIGTPWINGPPKFKDTYEVAIRRLISTEKRLAKEGPTVSRMYNDVIKDHLHKGYIREVSRSEEKLTKCLLAHFPIINFLKETTKLRIVFDASAKTGGRSLNDEILIGPKLQQDLIQVLLQFRRYEVAMCSDVSEMYLRIHLPENEKAYFRFLWRGGVPQGKPQYLEFNRLVFGIGSSPFLAQYVNNENAKRNAELLPLAAATVKNSTYMDDGLDSDKTTKLAMELFRQLVLLYQKIGMEVKKWMSNSYQVMEKIPQEIRVRQVDLSKAALPNMKTLGLSWDPAQDEFFFEVSTTKEVILTKRGILSKIATTFDPLGFVSPVTIVGKIILQELWQLQTSWDDNLPTEIAEKVKNWVEDLKQIKFFRIPQCLNWTKDEECRQLHIFSDASEEAYGTVIFHRVVYQDEEILTRIVIAKSRVAPLKTFSIPRLELMAALLGAQLAHKVKRILEIKAEDTFHWVDSEDVLHWINGISRKYKPFIAHRIAEMQELTEGANWRYVPTKVNIADILSRGVTSKALQENKQWLEGPEFLKKSPGEWPEMKKLLTVSAEVRKKYEQTNFSLQTNSDISLRNLGLDIEKYSQFRKIVRVTAWILRFIQRISGEKVEEKELTSVEENEAQLLWIRETQQIYFKNEIASLHQQKTVTYKSKLLPMNPWLDQDQVLRANTRLSESKYLPWSVKFPIILPKEGRVTSLILKQLHQNLAHAKIGIMLNEMNKEFWIPSMRETIKVELKKCLVCRKREAKPEIPIMAPLPSHRSEVTMQPFLNTAIDFAGPYFTKAGRTRVQNKRYMCLFTCVQTRAVHIELAFSLSSDGFLSCLSRMIARRGVPKVIISDNGTNFVKANKELKKLSQVWKEEQIQTYCSGRGIKWLFNPPSAPHFGGVFEAMIKSAKRTCNKVLHHADINDEELLSALIITEGFLNSRPLLYQSIDSVSEPVLTPNHFLIGRASANLSVEPQNEAVRNPRLRWLKVQELTRHIWHRWVQEWIPQIRARSKWNTDTVPIKLGDMVLVIFDDTPKGHWPLGRIQEVYPGTDGRIRVVDVQVGKKIFKRPVAKLCPLHLEKI